MPDAYTYIGPEPELVYMSYRDMDTGEALTGRPGLTCRIAATEDRWPVPPPDGRWIPADDGGGKAVKGKPKGDTGAVAGDEPAKGGE